MMMEEETKVNPIERKNSDQIEEEENKTFAEAFTKEWLSLGRKEKIKLLDLNDQRHAITDTGYNLSNHLDSRPHMSLDFHVSIRSDEVWLDCLQLVYYRLTKKYDYPELLYKMARRRRRFINKNSKEVYALSHPAPYTALPSLKYDNFMTNYRIYIKDFAIDLYKVLENYRIPGFVRRILDRCIYNSKDFVSLDEIHKLCRGFMIFPL